MAIEITDADKAWATAALGYEVEAEPGVIVRSDGTLEHVVFLVPIEDKPVSTTDEESD